jgi:peptidoglycan hydrolase-like protein with peptidoglycan-binding domain
VAGTFGAGTFGSGTFGGGNTNLAGTTSADVTLSATSGLRYHLGADSSAELTLAGTAHTAHALTATLAADLTLDGALHSDDIFGTLSADVTLAGSLVTAHALAGATSAAVTLSGDLSLPAVHNLAGALSLDVVAQNAALRILRHLAGTVTAQLGLAGTLNDVSLHLGSWTDDDSGKFRIPVGLEARLSVDVPVAAPPAGITPVALTRRSYTWPTPQLDTWGRPIAWAPSSVTEADAGVLQVICGGLDYTYFRGVPVVVRSWTKNEPFGDATAELYFPQLSVFERMSHGDRLLLRKGKEVTINLVRTDGSKLVVFEGFVIANTYEGNDGVVIEALGALYQADLQLQPPPFYLQTLDIGERIADLLDGTAARTFGKANRPVTGILTRQRGSWGHRLTGGVQDMLATATTDDGTNQWTVHKAPGRLPVIELKDRDTIHWHVAAGAPGVLLRISDDAATAVNTIFGEGIDPEGCTWRNSKYPNLRLDDAPIYPYVDPSETIGIGDSGAGVLAWETEMAGAGYPLTPDGTYSAADAVQARAMQTLAGLQVDGIVGPQTWAATFDVGANGGDLSGALFLPLYSWVFTEPYLYSASGAIIGDNPHLIPSALRVERFENFGEGIRRDQGLRSAEAEFRRDFFPEGQNFAGSITLETDPEEGSRFEIDAGHNVHVRYFTQRSESNNDTSTDMIFHVSSVSVDLFAGRVDLTVDSRARDLITLGAVLARNADAADPARRAGLGSARRSRNTQDQIVTFDCESGAGMIPRHALYGGLWTVIRIAAGQIGTIVKTEFQTDSPLTHYSVGIFGSPVQPDDLLELVGNPFGASTEDGRSPWQRDPDALDEAGLLVSWGQADQPMGYYPGAYSGGAALTGRFLDAASWTYETAIPPWLWVAEYAAASTFITGRLYAGVQV